MKRPAVFFDRDNTLIACDAYLGDPERVELVAGAAAAVARVRALGFATVIVSNQSGVARGMFGEDAVHAVNARLDELLTAANPAAIIDRHEFCPFHPEAADERYRQDSDLRKPKPGMILSAARAMALDLSRSWMIGDTARDVEAGYAAGCRTILFNDPALAASPDASAEALSKARPEFTATSLKEAVDYIEKQSVAAQPMRLVGAAPAASATPVAPPNAPVAPVAPAKAASPAVPVKPAAAKATAPAPVTPQADRPVPNTRLELVAEQILLELRRRNEQVHTDFSVSKLLAGIVQVLVLATLFLGYVRGSALPVLQIYVLVALTLQAMTIALLIMSRQK